MLPYNVINTIDELIRKKSCILFCGSGISFNSGIPTVDPFLNYLLQKLDIRSEHAEAFKKAGFPFEATMEIINEFVDIKPLLSVFRINQPNQNHFLIAKLVKSNFINVVITTNFDNNIELALTGTGMKRDRDFEVLTSEKEVSNFHYNHKKKYLIKIHGSIEKKDSLLTFIQRVATRNNQITIKYFLDKIFKINKAAILFCGYSFSDQFDVNPALMEINKSNKYVYTVSHQSDSSGIAINKIVDKPLITKGYEILCDFNHLSSELSKRFHCKHHSVELKINWKDYVDDWIENTLNTHAENDQGLNDKNILALNLFFKIRNFELIKFYLQKAVTENWLQKHVLYRMEIFSKSGHFHTLLGMYSGEQNAWNIAADEMRKALNLSKSISDQFNEALYSGSLGSILMRIEKLDEAKYLIEKALAYFEYQMNDPNEPHPDQAKRHYVGHLLNLASCERIRGNFERSLKILIIANKYADELGHLEIKSQIAYGMSLLYTQTQKFISAENSLRISFEIAQKLKLADRLIESFLDLTKIIYVNHGYNFAKEFYYQHQINIKPFAFDMPSLEDIIQNRKKIFFENLI